MSDDLIPLEVGDLRLISNNLVCWDEPFPSRNAEDFGYVKVGGFFLVVNINHFNSECTLATSEGLKYAHEKQVLKDSKGFK